VRSFVALPVPDGFAARLGSLMRELEPLVPGLRFVPTENIHVTLRFLGSATEEQIAILAPRLQAAAARCPRGEARVAGLGLFPARGAPRVLFMGLALPERFATLQRECEAAAVAAGFLPEERPFHPHLTLGRWRDSSGRPRLPAADLGTCPLEDLVLFASKTLPGGSVYTRQAQFPLPG
jgi:RNA 2',3'-cyclic 3'-phosphodiesterase